MKNRSDSYESLLSSCTWRDLNPHPSNMDMNLNHARMPIPPQVPDPVPLSQALHHNNTDCWFCQAKNDKTNKTTHNKFDPPHSIFLPSKHQSVKYHLIIHGAAGVLQSINHGSTTVNS